MIAGEKRAGGLTVAGEYISFFLRSLVKYSLIISRDATSSHFYLCSSQIISNFFNTLNFTFIYTFLIMKFGEVTTHVVTRVQLIS